MGHPAKLGPWMPTVPKKQPAWGRGITWDSAGGGRSDRIALEATRPGRLRAAREAPDSHRRASHPRATDARLGRGVEGDRPGDGRQSVGAETGRAWRELGQRRRANCSARSTRKAEGAERPSRRGTGAGTARRRRDLCRDSPKRRHDVCRGQVSRNRRVLARWPWSDGTRPPISCAVHAGPDSGTAVVRGA